MYSLFKIIHRTESGGESCGVKQGTWSKLLKPEFPGPRWMLTLPRLESLLIPRFSFHEDGIKFGVFFPSKFFRATAIKRKVLAAEFTSNDNWPSVSQVYSLVQLPITVPTSLLLGGFCLFFSAPCQLIHISWFGKHHHHPTSFFLGKTSWVDIKENCYLTQEL